MRRRPTNDDDGSLRLGKGAAFVKSRLRCLSQAEDAWEADFQPNPDEYGWLGLVVSQTDQFVLADLMIEHEPTVNDLADLLAKAMKRPLVERAHRPTKVCLRNIPTWNELLRHLEELGIEVLLQKHLPKAEEELAIFFNEFYGKKHPIDQQYPTVAFWVRKAGWIEIGQIDGYHFAARALDEGGMIFEANDLQSLDDALSVLEEDIAAWLERHDGSAQPPH